MKTFLLFLLPLALISCQENPANAEPPQRYAAQMVEIAPDAELDDPEFYLCSDTGMVHSRIALSYEGGFWQLDAECFVALAQSEERYTYDGLVLVRFIINCEKVTGRFRFQTMDAGFVHQECPDALQAEIKDCAAKLDKWTFIREENRGMDHSKFLNFKFENGKFLLIIH
jgi:hypothetical protein